KGREDSAKTAEFLKKAGINIDIIWHSTKTRAIETAQIFAQKLLSKERTEHKEGLAPNDPVDKVFADIATLKKDIMIVGHLPFLQKIVSFALTDSELNEIVKFNMGGTVCLERDETGKWRLIFEITPDLLK
ncbi:MAG: phosphohistidine phosphatase SixA, partial [Candidatus Omnitrophica bacterium]|nr:phosphohistidine phosphatase SixA [Candidatus Omnitrophota bacterium]